MAPSADMNPRRTREPAIIVDVPIPVGPVTYVGRVPVFDRRMDVAGYELVIDEFDDGTSGAPATTERSRRLMTRVLLEVGLDSLIGGKLGFLGVTIDLLADGVHLALPPHRMMLEVSGPIDAPGLDVLREVRSEGYRVVIGSLDECTHPAEAVRLAAGLRVDAKAPDAGQQMNQAHGWNPRIQILVDGVPSSDEVDSWRQMGACWVRGDLLRPAEQVDEPTIPLHRLAVLQLLAELERPDVDFDDIDRLVSTDLGMSYKLLRMANSSYLALERRVERTRDAVVYLGLDTVRAAAALLSLSEVSDHPPEIVQLCLVRARHCEELARRQHPELGPAAFTTGLFSSLDVLLGLSMEQVLMRIPIADHIGDALRDRTGELGSILEVALAYEAGDLSRLNRLRFEPASTVLAYRHALGWMAKIQRGLHGSPSEHRPL